LNNTISGLTSISTTSGTVSTLATTANDIVNKTTLDNGLNTKVSSVTATTPNLQLTGTAINPIVSLNSTLSNMQEIDVNGLGVLLNGTNTTLKLSGANNTIKLDGTNNVIQLNGQSSYIKNNGINGNMGRQLIELCEYVAYANGIQDAPIILTWTESTGILRLQTSGGLNNNALYALKPYLRNGYLRPRCFIPLRMDMPAMTGKFVAYQILATTGTTVNQLHFGMASKQYLDALANWYTTSSNGWGLYNATGNNDIINTFVMEFTTSGGMFRYAPQSNATACTLQTGTGYTANFGTGDIIVINTLGNQGTTYLYVSAFTVSGTTATLKCQFQVPMRSGGSSASGDTYCEYVPYLSNMSIDVTVNILGDRALNSLITNWVYGSAFGNFRRDTKLNIFY
jgi:hypothetical protein